MLTSCVASKSVCEQEQAASVIRSAIGEAFQYGPETFKITCEKLRRMVKACNLDAFVTDSTFPVYEQLVEAHYRACTREECSSCKEALLGFDQNMVPLSARSLQEDSDVLPATLQTVSHAGAPRSSYLGMM